MTGAETRPTLNDLLHAPGAPLTNWREIIAQVDTDFGEAETSGKRGALLGVFKSTMDLVEDKLVQPEQLPDFKEARRKHYSAFIVQECLVGENVSVDDLYAVTQREIADGRMTEEHPLRMGAVEQFSQPHFSRAQLQAQADDPEGYAASLQPRKVSIWGKVKGALKR